GTGAAPTVQYSLNGATHNLEYRWSADYDYREPITIVAVNAVASGYAVALTFNHAALVTLVKSLPSGDDVRVRYWNGTSMTELDRVVDPTSAWNNPITNTKIWFRLQEIGRASCRERVWHPVGGGRCEAETRGLRRCAVYHIPPCRSTLHH